MASSPPRSASASQAVMLARAQASAVGLAAQVMGQRAAALLVLDQHDLDAVTRQQVDGGLVDSRRQHLLGASLQQRDPPAPFALRRKNAAAGAVPARGRLRGDKRQHRLDSPQQSRPSRDAPAGPAARPANGRARRARIMLARNSRAAAARARAPRGAAVRPAALCSPLRSSPAPDRPDACSSRPTDRWSCRQGRTDSGRCA